MSRSLTSPLLGSQFNDFLFAPVGEEKNGMLLSVLSALARLDLDAWQEAATLARLPRTTATERLAGLIATLPDAVLVHKNPAEIASRLIERLPRPTYSDLLTADSAPATNMRAANRIQTLLFLALVLMLFIENLGLANNQLTVVNVNNASAPITSGSAPQLPISKGPQ